MKIYEYAPISFIRIKISKIGEDDKYLSLVETNREEVEKMVIDIVKAQNVDPFSHGYRTKVDIREAVGSKNGKSKSLSFHGLSVEDTYNLIIAHIQNK